MKPAAFPSVLFSVLVVPVTLPAQTPKQGLTELRNQLSSHDYHVYEAALKGFLRLGANAGPTLVAVLREHAKKEAMPRPARLAARGLALLEDRATAMIPDLMRELPRGSDDYFQLVAGTLGRIGPFAPKLRLSIKREILRRVDRRFYYEDACIAASRMEVDPKAGPAELRAVLNGTDVAKKVLVCEILSRAGASGEWAQDDLRALLRNGRHGRTVEIWLADVGVNKRVWSETLDDEHVNCEIAHALVRVSRNQDVPMQAFLQLLAHPRPEYRREAAVGLGARGVAAGPAVLDLVRSSNESRDQVAWEAITALGLVGPRAQAAIPHLEYLARGRNKGRAVRAEVALAQIRRK